MALYDFSYKTGNSFGDLYSPKDDTCYVDSFFSSLALTSPDISGLHYSRLSCNGQTLVEQKGVFQDVGFDGAYSNSGDYYFKSGETYRMVSFNSDFNLEIGPSSAFFYNIKDNIIEVPMGTGTSAALRQSGLREQMAARFSSRTGTLTGLNSFDYFANGQKIYTGLVSGSYRISGSPPLFYYDDTYSGKIFAIPKNTGLKNYTGNAADIYGDKFVESTVFGYANGASMHRKNWLELSTGVTLIETGIQALIFDPIQDTETISL